MRRSNTLHQRYLQDPALLADFDRFTRLQLDYLLQFFTDLYKEQGYSQAIEFIMSDLAGTSISKRDDDLERAAPVITRTLPLGALQTAAAAADMNANVLRMNLAIFGALLVDGRLPDGITTDEYMAACRRSSSFDEWAQLVQLFTELGNALKSLVRMPLLGGLLRAMRAPAHATGFGALQEFLEQGWVTFRGLPDVDLFLAEIEQRMMKIMQDIYLINNSNNPL